MSLSSLDNLYRQMILEHADRPHHHGNLPVADKQIELRNPTCGDVLELEVKLDDEGKIADIAFNGTGCTISQASASMMTDEVIGKTPAIRHPIQALYFHSWALSSFSNAW